MVRSIHRRYTMYQLNLSHDQSERIDFPVPHMNVRGYRGKLYDYQDHLVPLHRHMELEFIVVEQGTASYCINSRSYLLKPGQVLFVNSNRMHSGYSPSGEDFCYSVLQIRPAQLAENIYISEEYLNPLISIDSLDGLLLTGESPWQKQMVEQVIKLIELNTTYPYYYELETLSLLYHILQVLHQNMVIRELARNSRYPNAEALHKMTAYIHKNYTEKIMLKDIAAAGAVCTSKCCKLFQEILKQSPILYLQNYRIQCSVSMLTNRSLNITEIATLCGFSGASYYIEVFRRRTGMTPREFQRRFLESALAEDPHATHPS